MTNLMLPTDELVPNHALRAAIQEWRRTRPPVSVDRFHREYVKLDLDRRLPDLRYRGSGPALPGVHIPIPSGRSGAAYLDVAFFF
ncbi:hypothetical protein ACQ4PT_016682 [Festuca glaucescens]